MENGYTKDEEMEDRRKSDREWNGDDFGICSLADSWTISHG
jgi:hypothetical protein